MENIIADLAGQEIELLPSRVALATTTTPWGKIDIDATNLGLAFDHSNATAAQVITTTQH